MYKKQVIHIGLGSCRLEDSKKRIILNIELIKILLYLHLSNHLIIDKNMNKRNMTVNISGGQVNIAKDNATINAIHNNGMNGKEFETIIQTIKDNLSGLKKEDGDEILDVLEQVKEEIDKEKPKKSRLQNCLKLIAPMITIANGIPVLATNLQKLQDIIIQCIMNL